VTHERETVEAITAFAAGLNQSLSDAHPLLMKNSCLIRLCSL
jgi:hypothetical protein